MSIEIVTPELGKVKRSTKDLVISTLTYEHPLTLIELFNSIKKKFGSNVTYQGIRKAVNQLEDNKVIAKKGKGYSLNKEWITNLRHFAENLHESYFIQNTEIKNIEAIGEDIKVYTLSNLIDLDQFINQLIGNWFKEKPNGTYLQKAGHAYFMMGNLEEENRINELMTKLKVKFYTLVGGNSLVDKWAGNYFKKQKFFYACGEGDTSKYYGMYGDYLFQYETPKELTKKIDEVYAKVKRFEDLDVAKLISLLRQNIGIKIMVMRNPLLSEQLSNSILDNFKKLKQKVHHNR